MHGMQGGHQQMMNQMPQMMHQQQQQQQQQMMQQQQQPILMQQQQQPPPPLQQQIPPQIQQQMLLQQQQQQQQQQMQMSQQSLLPPSLPLQPPPPPPPPPQQQQQIPNQQQQQQQSTATSSTTAMDNLQKLDNITKVKSLIGPLRDSFSNSMRMAAQMLALNCTVDTGGKISDEANLKRFDKSLEEFLAYCDQIELELINAIKSLEQSIDASRYLPYPVIATRTEVLGMPEPGTLSYPVFLQTVNAQLSFIKALHDMLVAAAETITPAD